MNKNDFFCKSGVKVSICMLAYNHQDYIEDSIKAVINQKVNFRYELLIHDDASSDMTSQIIRSYAKKYPEIIKPFFQDENIWSRGLSPSVFFNYPRASGDYIAWCEGDDQWIDENKLQLQVDVLDSMPDVEMCFHKAIQINLINGENKIIGEYSSKDGLIRFEDVFLRSHGMIPTASCMVRRGVMKRFEKFSASRPYLTSGDIYVQALGALKGGAFFINKSMSIYRLATPSSLTKEMLNSDYKFVSHHIACIRGMISLWKNFFPSSTENILKKVVYKRIVWLFLLTNRANNLVDILKIQSLRNIYADIDSYFDEISKQVKGRRVVLYGAGNEGAALIKKIGYMSFDFVIDRDDPTKTGYFNSVKYGAIEELSKNKDVILLVSAIFYDESKLNEVLENMSFDFSNVVKIEKRIIDLVNIENIWRGEVIWDQKDVLKINKRVPAWWE